MFKLPHTPDLSSISSKTFEGVLTPTLSADILDFHRQHIWAFTLDAALNSPIIGHGINVSNYLPGADIIISQFNQAFIPGHPHNWFLEVFLETGSIGLLALIAALLILLINWARLSKKELFSSTVGISIFASFWASSMLNFSIWASWWQAVFLILTVIVFSSSGTNRISNKMQQKK